MKTFVIIISLLFTAFFAEAQKKSGVSSGNSSGIQKKVNLDDIQIKGEAQNKGLNVLARQKNSLDGRITLRTSYRNEILAEMPRGYVPIRSIKTDK